MSGRPRLVAAPADAGTAIDLVARTVWGEARTLSLRAMEAVAAVVVNRFRAAGCRYGATVAAVCLAPGAFACWAPSHPDREAVLTAAPGDPVFDLCRRIARRALGGGLADPTGGAVRWHDVGEMPAWAIGRVPLARIGDRLFHGEGE